MYVHAIKDLLKSKMTTKIRSKLSKNRKRTSTSCHEDQEENGSNMKNVKINEDETNNSLGIFTRISNARLECATSVAFFNFNKKRVKVLSEIEDVPEDCEGIVYWMSRDQRVQDNWAFLYAQRTALKCKIPLHVCFCLVPKFLDATIRQYSFLLEGLKEVEQECISLNINFHLLLGEAKNVLPEFIKNHKIGGIICDFSPLRVPQKWIEDVNKATSNIPFCQVDAHNIVPCWIATDKLEYSARTIRNKIHNKLAEFLTEYPPVIYHPFSAEIKNEPVDWISAEASLQVDGKVKTVEWAQPGSKTALEKLDEFCQHRLKLFADKRNDPTQNNLSNLSPWIHFGQISVQRCILEVSRYKNKWKQSVDTYTEEAVVRRELADNFCFYNPNYDNILGASEWARRTLNEHKKDKREYLYSKEQFEEGMTHDPLWNAAQLQMVREGKMHGFLRMYWAKKILEWTTNPEEALKLAIYLNDKYELDGRDPNGYVGCMWSICGTHDQGWAERAIFGKIRYMNYAGCKRKFDVDAFINKYPIPKKDKNVKTR